MTTKEYFYPLLVNELTDHPGCVPSLFDHTLCCQLFTGRTLDDIWTVLESIINPRDFVLSRLEKLVDYVVSLMPEIDDLLQTGIYWIDEVIEDYEHHTDVVNLEYGLCQLDKCDIYLVFLEPLMPEDGPHWSQLLQESRLYRQYAEDLLASRRRSG